MDWQLAIERNRDALKRIVAMLVAMAGYAESLTSPQNPGTGGGRRKASGGGGDGTITPTRRSADRRPPHKGEVESAPTLPRHLHRAILRLLRPAESAVRRLVIVAARGLVVALPPPRRRQPQPPPTILRNGVGTGIVMPAGTSPSPLWGGAGVGVRPRACLPLLDPLRPARLRRPSATSVPRISLPGVTAPFPVAPRRPPAPDDLIDATRLSLRLEALGIALDDLPKQARRFARWQARYRVAAGAQDKGRVAAGAQDKDRVAAGTRTGAGQGRRIWPLRPGRPPGQRPACQRTHEVHDILHDLHGLAFDLLESPDTS